MKEIDFDNFLKSNRIKKENWEEVQSYWNELIAIAEDFLKQKELLEATAELIANRIQRYPSVHSVRWRVKDCDHLIEKIIRKKIERNDKYNDINVSNYFEKISDLVGIRAIHLFKSDCFTVDKNIRNDWILAEDPVAYIRSGDDDYLINKFKDIGLKIEEHPAGYRSVHYVISSKPMNRVVLSEIQVRTIFEEGWSEVDHFVRYPNFSNNNLVEYFLQIFNRLAGSADEMGGFVRGLLDELHALEIQNTEIRNERDKTLADMEDIVSKFQSIKEKDIETNKTINLLKTEIDKLKNENMKLELLEKRTRGAVIGIPSTIKLGGLDGKSGSFFLGKSPEIQSGLLGLLDPSIGSINIDSSTDSLQISQASNFFKLQNIKKD